MLLSCENFITHPSLWVLWEMFLRKKIEKRWILERFGAYFNIILSLKSYLFTCEIMIVQPGG